MCIFPDFRLIGADPVNLGFLLQIGNRFCQTGHSKDQPPQAADRRHPVGFALVQPHHGRPQRVAVFVDVNHTSTLGGYSDSGDAVFIDIVAIPNILTGLNQ